VLDLVVEDLTNSTRHDVGWGRSTRKGFERNVGWEERAASSNWKIWLSSVDTATTCWRVLPEPEQSWVPQEVRGGKVEKISNY
jgi:hypothetical protein